MSATQELLKFVSALSYEELPPHIVQRAKELILDTLAVTVAGVDAESARIAQAVAQEQGSRPACTVLGTNIRASPVMAAFANGVAAHARDYDDNSWLTGTHLSGSLVNALLALAEQHALSGKKFIESFVAAHEGLGRLAKGFDNVTTIMGTGGWHLTGVFGSLGSVMGCAKLVNLDQQKAIYALGLACSMTSGLRGNWGSHTKALHEGLAAKNAVLSASLAASGFTAGPNILEHPLGFGATYVGKEHCQFTEMEKACNDRGWWALLDPGIGIKLSPCNSAVLPAIQATVALVREHDIRPEQVEAIEYGHSGVPPKLAMWDDPQTSPQAMYSMTHAVAAPIVFRKMGVKEFEEAAVHDPRVVALRKKVRTYVHPDLTKMEDIHDLAAAHITVRLKGGRSVTRYQRRSDAYPGGQPLMREGLLEKVNDCITHNLSEKNARRCVELVDHLEEVKDMSQVAATLAAP